MYMNQQLIVMILGANKVGILSELANIVSETQCNILDSRQAIYGQDFSLTMILEGSQTAITKAEIKIPQVCQRLDLLSMMKRTKRHCKQNLEHLVDVHISGKDTPGVIHKVSSLLAQRSAAVSALRQYTFKDKESDADMMKVKLVASVPIEQDMASLNAQFSELMESLSLVGKITENH